MSSVVPSKIFPNLYLGSEYTAVNKKVLDELNIKAIINITPDVPNYFEKEGIYYHQIPVGDDLYTEIACYFEDAVEFINSHIKNGKSVLVHCRMGISRSPSIVIAYIMKTKNISFMNALEFVQQKHKDTDPNLNFCGQLANYKF